MQNNTQYIQEDKIDLRELFDILKRRKKLIWAMTGSITVLAIIYALIKQPIYEVKSNVMVGFIGEDTKNKSAYIADPEVIAKRLNIVFNVEDEVKTKEEFVSNVSSIAINKKLKNFIIIKTEALSNEEALKKNKEVIQYLKDLYQPRLDQYIINTKNNIKNIKQDIINIDNFEIKNIRQEIKQLKTQKIVKIDEKIERLKEQDIKKLQREINILKTQKIVKIDEKIKFYKNIELPSIGKKIDFHTLKLTEYTQAVDNLYKNTAKDGDVAVQTISSMQMLNYQNMILNSQNKIEDLNIKKETINNDKIVNLQREKKNIKNETIKDLQLKIENINNVIITNLQREKKNIASETIRILEYKMNVDLVTKKIKLEEEIQQLTYNISNQHVQNSKVIGEYVIKDYSIKPKKKLIVIVAFITGLMLSIFLAFFLAFIGGMKKEEISE